MNFSEDVCRISIGYPDQSFCTYIGMDANVILPLNISGMTGDRVISTKHTHKKIWIRLLVGWKHTVLKHSRATGRKGRNLGRGPVDEETVDG